MRSPARLRDREALAAEIAVLHTQITDTQTAADFPRAALDALRWMPCAGSPTAARRP